MSIEHAFRKVAEEMAGDLDRAGQGDGPDDRRAQLSQGAPAGLREPGARGSRSSRQGGDRLPDPVRALRHPARRLAARAGAGEPVDADGGRREEGRRPAAQADGADDRLLPAGAVRRHHHPGRRCRSSTADRRSDPAGRDPSSHQRRGSTPAVGARPPTSIPMRSFPADGCRHVPENRGAGAGCGGPSRNARRAPVVRMVRRLFHASAPARRRRRCRRRPRPSSSRVRCATTAAMPRASAGHCARSAWSQAAGSRPSPCIIARKNCGSMAAIAR